jgi:NAD(P)-dependent dehydrogenase (short-subunit alcohol dehydrogenase family)
MADRNFGQQGWTPERIGSLNGKTYLITGANSGTGFEATRILLSKGATVVMLNRNPQKSSDAINELKREFGSEAKVSFVQMDLAEQASVKKAAEEVLASVSRIDALMCNGAIAQVPKLERTVDGFESQLGVNHYGHFLLQGLLFPMIESSNGRIVVVGSEGYKMGIKTIQFEDMNWEKNYHQNNTYCHSKLAQIMSVYELQDRLKKANKTGVKVYACHPGSSATSLITTSGNLATRVAFKLMSLSPLVQSAEKGSYPELMCATEDNLEQTGFYGPTGFMDFVGPVGDCGIAPHAVDKNVSKKLWELSEQAIGFKWGI